MHGKAGLPCVHTANAINQCLARHVLEQITLRPRLNCSVNIFVAIERREHDNPRVLILSTNLFDNANTIELGHAQVEQRHVGPMLFPKIDRFTSVTGFSDDHHVCFEPDQRNQTLAEDAVIVGNKHADAMLFWCDLNFRRFLRSRRWFLSGFLRLRGRCSFGCHNIDSPLLGNTTVIFVPLPRELVIFNSPPICSTRSRMPARPRPSCRSCRLNPSPSSENSKRSSFGSYINRVRNLRACAYLIALARASCPMCNKFSCQTGGSWSTLP